MSDFERFYIKEENGWGSLYTHFETVQKCLEGLDESKPSHYKNQKIFEDIQVKIDFLIKLYTDQAIRLEGLHHNASKVSNAVRSLLSVYEDDQMDLIPVKRFKEIRDSCFDALDNVLVAINKHKYAIPIGEKSDLLKDTETPEDIPVLSPDSTFDNLRDAMRIALRQMRDDEAMREKVDKLLSPEERLFKDIREGLEKTVSNFSVAATKTRTGVIQFATGTLALQGYLDRRALLRIPHSVVQFSPLRLSAKVSDGMIPTYFLHEQRFAVFDPLKDEDGHTRVIESKSDLINRVQELRELAVLKKPESVDALREPLIHRLFGGIYFLWLPDALTIERLSLRNVRAELSF